MKIDTVLKKNPISVGSHLDQQIFYSSNTFFHSQRKNFLYTILINSDIFFTFAAPQYPL